MPAESSEFSPEDAGKPRRAVGRGWGDRVSTESGWGQTARERMEPGVMVQGKKMRPE